MSRYRRLKIEGGFFSRLRSPTAAVTRTDYPKVSTREGVGTAALAAAPTLANRRCLLINDLNNCVSPRVNQHRVSVDYRVPVLSGTRIFGRYFVIRHASIREHGANANFTGIFVGRVMAIGNIAMKPGTIVDTQYTVHAAYDAANDAANNGSDGTSIVLTDASAMSGAIWYALSICCSRHCEGHGADE